MKKYKFTFDQISEFAGYLTTCIMYITDKEQGTLGGLLHFHLNELRCKCAVKLFMMQMKQQKTVQVPFDYGELLTLSYCFKQWETPAFLKGIEFNLIGAL
jgi:hypothetical protein